MTPEPYQATAEAAMQFVSEQQGNFATAVLKMQNQLERIAVHGLEMEAGLGRLTAMVDQLTEFARQAEADRQRARAELGQLRQEVAGLRSAFEARRHAT